MASRIVEAMSVGDFEAQRRAVAMAIFHECHQFMVLDNEINRSVISLARTVSTFVAEHPDIFGGSATGKPLSTPPVGSAPDEQDLGYTGGGDWDSTWNAVKDVITFIKEIGGSEKEFIKEIIKHILDL